MSLACEPLMRRWARVARRVLPRFLFNILRSVGTALGTPLIFSLSSGHFRSSFARRAVDRHGHPIPWYTYPAIDYLSRKDFRNTRVLEWGAGQSTLWWAGRARAVVAVESDQSWYEALRPQLPSNAVVHLTGPDLSALRDKINGPFDLIIVDGLDRLRCAELSLDLLSEGGAILLDNSEGTWSGDGSYPIIELFKRCNFSRVDFYGYSPGVSSKQCTSLFFRTGCFLFSDAKPPVIPD
jgi:hypothetical protein